MFEKSLYDLIRGLRRHKGGETEYIQSTLRECRAEVRSQDMDVKATALLKLIYLDMFGHEMSWASFHVLEVMSSNKQMQKRVGYLGAAQTFRADTEVLMLATNLLKKDLSASAVGTMSLPLVTLPHMATSSLALSLLPDLLPRLAHSRPTVRKKTVVVLYRLALVYPETLRVAWPKIKERLMVEDEDSTVTAAVVNVVCELGWRRPQDFLPLAPRLFDLLIQEGNNWMLIKIIKLFATLTPFEPRLVKKLVRPLTNLIKSTEAMSLLYECINGIIQGGIINATENGREGEELAGLCLDKLRAMILVENDPNLKYVALLALNKIVVSYPAMVSAQQDVVMGCLDDLDPSIRLQALELVSGMVNPDNIEFIVNRLMKQLQDSPQESVGGENGDLITMPTEPMAVTEGEDLAEKVLQEQGSSAMPPVPNDYRGEVTRRILRMCGRETYANVADFDWYLGVLVQLIRLLPPSTSTHQSSDTAMSDDAGAEALGEIIGFQLRDIAVRVKAMRVEACRTAELLLSVTNRTILFPPLGNAAYPVLEPCAWIVGEYAEYLTSAWAALDSLIHTSSEGLSAQILRAYIQAAAKIFVRVSALAQDHWDASQKTKISLLLSRLIAFLEHLSTHPDLGVQERAAEFLELFRLVAEALAPRSADDETPRLLASALPELFSGQDLKPVAQDAQKKIALPDELDLTTPINPKLPRLLEKSQANWNDETDKDFHAFYYDRDPQPANSLASNRVKEPGNAEHLNQGSEDPEELAKRKTDRLERNRDDPFYIPESRNRSGRPSPNGGLGRDHTEELDLDAIPIVDLRLHELGSDTPGEARKKVKAARRVEVARDENFDLDQPSSGTQSAPRSFDAGNILQIDGKMGRSKNLLQVDSSRLQQLSLTDDHDGGQSDIERRQADEAEMAAALREVERMRLEMQRRSERVETAEGVDLEGTMVKRKKRRKPKAKMQDEENQDAEGPTKEEKVEGKGERGKTKKRKKKEKMTKQRTDEERLVS